MAPASEPKPHAIITRRPGDSPYPYPSPLPVAHEDDVSTDPTDFWNHKIIGWERGRYDTHDAGSMLERLADRASDSLRFRLSSAGRLLAPHVAGKRVLDVGCGSGRLADALLAAGASSYHGIDISSAAVEEGRQRAERSGWTQATFSQGDTRAIADFEADIVVSLGLLDWLRDDELETLFQAQGGADYFHAIAERRHAPTQWLHRAYVWLAYGHRTGGYVPRYYRVTDLQARLDAAGAPPVRVWRHRRLTFGAYLTSLPVEDATA